MHKHHTKDEYEKAMQLLGEHKSCGKVAKLTGIPRTTIRNWKLGYCFHPDARHIISEADILPKIRKIIKTSNNVPQIAKELNISYNTALPVIKRNFGALYKNKLKRKFHTLTEHQKKMTPRLAYILGVMFGDGCVSSKDKTIRLGVIDQDFRDTFANDIEIWSRKKPYRAQYLNRGRIHYQCILNSKDAGIFLDEIRKVGDVPSSIKESDNDKIRVMFIRGFADSEGGVLRGSMGIYNKKVAILESIKNMLIGMGTDEKHIRINCDKKGVYCLLLTTKNNLKIFAKKIKFSIKRKQEKLKAACGI